MTWAFELQGLTPSEKLVLLALADHADMEAVCWPRQDTLTKKTGLGIATVKRCIKSLRDKNLIKVYAQKVKGIQRVNRYKLNLGIMLVIGPGISLIPSQVSQGYPVGDHSDPLKNHQKESSVEPPMAQPPAEQGEPMKQFGQGDVEEALKSPLSDQSLTPTTIINSAKKSGSRYTVAVIRKVWGELYNYYGYGFLAEWTIKQRGQINQVQTKLGEMDVVQVVGLVLRDWHKFTAQTDAYKSPKRPDVGFLLKHIGTAGNLLLKESLQSIAKPVEGIFDLPKNLTKTTIKTEDKTNENTLDDE